MGKYVGGDIEEITYKHPTLGTGTLFAKAGEDNTYNIGGRRSTSDANMITGNGIMIDQKTTTRPFFECIVANDMNETKDLEAVVRLAEDPDPAEWTISITNGATLVFSGVPVGEYDGNIYQSTFTLRVEGSGKMKTV